MFRKHVGFRNLVIAMDPSFDSSVLRRDDRIRACGERPLKLLLADFARFRQSLTRAVFSDDAMHTQDSTRLSLTFWSSPFRVSKAFCCATAASRLCWQMLSSAWHVARASVLSLSFSASLSNDLPVSLRCWLGLSGRAPRPSGPLALGSSVWTFSFISSKISPGVFRAGGTVFGGGMSEGPGAVPTFRGGTTVGPVFGPVLAGTTKPALGAGGAVLGGGHRTPLRAECHDLTMSAETRPGVFCPCLSSVSSGSRACLGGPDAMACNDQARYQILCPMLRARPRLYQSYIACSNHGT